MTTDRRDLSDIYYYAQVKAGGSASRPSDIGLEAVLAALEPWLAVGIPMALVEEYIAARDDCDIWPDETCCPNAPKKVYDRMDRASEAIRAALEGKPS